MVRQGLAWTDIYHGDHHDNHHNNHHDNHYDNLTSAQTLKVCYSSIFYSFYKFLFTYILFRFHRKITGLIQVHLKIYIHTRVQTFDCIKVESTECSYKLSRLDTDMAAPWPSSWLETQPVVRQGLAWTD